MQRMNSIWQNSYALSILKILCSISILKTLVESLSGFLTLTFKQLMPIQHAFRQSLSYNLVD